MRGPYIPRALIIFGMWLPAKAEPLSKFFARFDSEKGARSGEMVSGLLVQVGLFRDRFPLVLFEGNRKRDVGCGRRASYDGAIIGVGGSPGEQAEQRIFRPLYKDAAGLVRFLIGHPETQPRQVVPFFVPVNA